MDINEDTWPGQFIHQAAIYNNVELLQCLLQGEERAQINAQDVCGRTAVYTAVSNGSLQCLQILLQNGGAEDIYTGPEGAPETTVLYNPPLIICDYTTGCFSWCS